MLDERFPLEDIQLPIVTQADLDDIPPAGIKMANPDINVILSSGYSLNGQAQSILDKGCNGFIQKPFSVQDLSIKLKEVMDNKSRNKRKI